MKLDILKQLFDDLGIESQHSGTTDFEGRFHETYSVRTPEGLLIEFQPSEGVIHVWDLTDTLPSYERSTSEYLDALDHVERMFQDADIQADSSKRDDGDYIIRIEDGVIGAEALEFVFGADDAKLTTIEINWD